MTHYMVEGPYNHTDLETMFPQTPDNAGDSIQELLEDRFASGWEFVFADNQSNNWRFFFKANGQP